MHDGTVVTFTTTLVATVFDGAQNPLPGIRVAFAASAGVLRERAVTTDLSGEARTVLATTTPAEVTAATVLDAADRRHASSIGIVVAEDSEG